MKSRGLLSMAMLVAAMTCAQAGTATYSLRGVEYTVDTLFHAYIGPGTTQTSLLLESGVKQLRVFYSKIDLSSPEVTLKAVSGTDRMTGSETVSGMARRKTAPGNRYYVGVNGDFWMTSGYTSRGVSMIGTPISSSMAEGVLYRGRNNDGEYQFTIDTDEVPHLGNVNFGGTVVKADGTTASIFGVNVDAGNNQITLYNPTYYSGTNQFGTCAEVQVRYVGGDEAFAFGQPCQLVVVGNPSTAGDIDVPSEGLVLHGRGTTYDFVNSLAAGDTLTLTLNAVLNGNSIEPREIISGQPWIVVNGETSPNGNPDVHPRTALGYSEDGKTVIFMVVDGRSPLSDGVTTDALGDLMRYAGAYMAVNVDGGGSSALYTSALGVRNRPSDGSERADSNGIFAVCSSPDDDEVASIRFLDWSLTMPKYGTYVPKFFGYNQYGMLVDTDVKGVTLLCPDNIGFVAMNIDPFVDGHLAHDGHEQFAVVEYRGAVGEVGPDERLRFCGFVGGVLGIGLRLVVFAGTRQFLDREIEIGCLLRIREEEVFLDVEHAIAIVDIPSAELIGVALVACCSEEEHTLHVDGQCSLEVDGRLPRLESRVVGRDPHLLIVGSGGTHHLHTDEHIRIALHFAHFLGRGHSAAGCQDESRQAKLDCLVYAFHFTFIERLSFFH